MKDSGYPLARRTVAKYREAMKIPKATLRRKILL
jgi:DNA-directed RNA polymerase specialized sigma54-like protein